ncbi:MAG: LLM class flavin-dependent oxidoreductase [Actinomycetota bacterium]|nr:LLM class flavin-dependent oxidoreductase [Actinomycetota bacterium]
MSLSLGITLPQFSPDARGLVDAAREVEDLGLDSIWVFDHMWPLSGKKVRPILECWMSLAYLAEATRSITIGTLVTRSTLRHPALLAKMASTVATIAPERTIVGLGSGDAMSAGENRAFGFSYFAGPDRIAQLRSSVRLLRAWFDGPRVDTDDEFHSARELPVSPRPDIPPRIWMGGRSDPLIELAREYGDGWNAWAVDLDELASGIAKLKGSARPVEITWAGTLIVGADDAEAAAQLGERDPASYLVGGPETVAERLGELEEAGVTHAVLTPLEWGDGRSLDLVANRVAPLVRS